MHISLIMLNSILHGMFKFSSQMILRPLTLLYLLSQHVHILLH